MEGKIEIVTRPKDAGNPDGIWEIVIKHGTQEKRTGAEGPKDGLIDRVQVTV